MLYQFPKLFWRPSIDQDWDTDWLVVSEEDRDSYPQLAADLEVWRDLSYYRKYRVDDQLDFYASRRDLFDRATGQGLAVSAMLLGFASAVSALAGTGVGWTEVWTAASAILPAISTALAAYLALYAFDQQSKLHGDFLRATRSAHARCPIPTIRKAGARQRRTSPTS